MRTNGRWPTGYDQDGRIDFRGRSYTTSGEIDERFLDRLTVRVGLRSTQEDKDGYYATITVSHG